MAESSKKELLSVRERIQKTERESSSVALGICQFHDQLSHFKMSGSLVPETFAKFRIQSGIPGGIAVCSTKTASEARRLVYLPPTPRVGNRFYNFE